MSPATIQRVYDAARELGYVPQAAAKTLRGERSRTIALLLGPLPPSPHVPIVQDVITTAMTRMEERGYLVLPVPQSKDDSDEIERTNRLLADIDLGGAIVEYTPRNAIAGRRLVEMDVPVVWISLGNAKELPPGVGHVEISEVDGVRRLLDELDLADDDEVGIVVGPIFRPPRLRALHDRFAGRMHLVEAASWLPDGGAEAARRLLGEHPDTRLIYCADDLLAFGALHALDADGIAVPETVSVVGYGDYELASWLDSGLTTTHWPVKEATLASVDTLLDALQEPLPEMYSSSTPVSATFQVEPVIRRSARTLP